MALAKFINSYLTFSINLSGKFAVETKILRLTQEQFAVELGFTWGTVNRWENGRHEPSPIARRQIEKMLVSLGDGAKDLLAKYSA